MAPKRPRVQAQRKFAQGVYIPPQQSVQVHTPPIHTPYAKVQTKVHMNCKELLDIVSLKDSIATNKRNLVVVLENIDTHCPKVTEVSNIPESNKKNVLNRERILITPVREPPSRKLRSRVTSPLDSEGENHNVSKETSPERSSTSPMRGKRRRSSSVTDAEEDKPLRFLSKEKGQMMPPMVNIHVNVDRWQEGLSNSTAGENSRSRRGSTTASTVPLAIIKAQRQGLRMSLRQMMRRNAPGFKKRSWGVTKRQDTDKKKSPKRSRITRAKGATSTGTSAESLPRAATAVGGANSILHCTDKQKVVARNSGAATITGPVAITTEPLPCENTDGVTTSTKTGNTQTSTALSSEGMENTRNSPDEPGPSKSAFKVPRGVAKRKRPAARVPICQPGPNGELCGQCERCEIVDEVITLGESMDTPNELNRVLDGIQDTEGANVVNTADTHDIYDFSNEDDRIDRPNPFTRQNRARPLSVQERLTSVDSVFGSSTPNTQTVIKVIDKQIRAIDALAIKSNSTSMAEKSENLINYWQQMKKKLLSFDEFFQAAALIKPEPDQVVQGDVVSCPIADEPPTDSSLPSTSRPSAISGGEMLLDAPIFRPRPEEMLDLTSYLSKIKPHAVPYGICKIVPPDNFRPPCHLKNVSFRSNNQYISTLYNRWSPVVREMTAIKAHLATQNVTFTRPPLFEGIEVDIVKLYNLVQKYGGLIQVMRQHKWGAIAEEMKLSAERIKPDLKFDKIYIKYILPYDTLSAAERDALLAKVDAAWARRYERLRARAADPLLRARRLLSGADDEEVEEEPLEPALLSAFAQTEDCIVSGQKMTLERFKKIGEQVQEMYFHNTPSPAPRAVEDKYWRRVAPGTDHVCVFSASLDTSQDNIGFPKQQKEHFGSHPWNLKRLCEDPRNVLSFLGPSLAATIPTLHLGMMFSSNCWHMDPHQLPWTEYMHEGPPKIWYGISTEQSAKFRAAMQKLCPTVVQNKSIWLPSDMAMVPPQQLISNGVRLSRVLQHPGEYIVVLPSAYSCSISTGFTVSESLYFADEKWIDRISHIFKELRDACEPSMFSAEELLTGIVNSSRPAEASLLQRAYSALRPMLEQELSARAATRDRDIPYLSPREYLQMYRRCSHSSWQVKCRDECELCRCTLVWSKMINVLGPRSSVCLQHGLQLLRKRTQPDDVCVIQFVSDDDLNNLRE